MHRQNNKWEFMCEQILLDRLCLAFFSRRLVVWIARNGCAIIWPNKWNYVCAFAASYFFILSLSLLRLFLVLFCVWDVIYMLNQFVIIEPSRHHHSVANQSSKSHFGTRIQRAQNALFYVPLGAFSCFKWNGFSSILSLIITISG